MLSDVFAIPADHTVNYTLRGESPLRLRLEAMMTVSKSAPMKDRKDIVKDRKDIGVVEFPIEKLMKFRDASASCVHIEAAMEADRGLTDTGSKRPK